MKQTNINIAGFSYQPAPDDKPSVGGFGLEGTGKTRFGCTMPHDDGVIGVLAIDKKSKRTFQQMAELMDVPYVANTKPFISDRDLVRMALLSHDDEVDKESKQQQVRKFYRDVVDSVFEAGEKLVLSPNVESIITDTAAQLFQWILFKHFGRAVKIPPTSRGDANQDMIDFINMMRAKNTLFINRASEVWKDTGRVDKQGNAIKEPTGRYEPDGFRGIGGHLTVNLEFQNKAVGAVDRGNGTEAALAKKFRVKVHKCQTNALLEGMDLETYGLSGEEITWDNLMTVIGFVG